MPKYKRRKKGGRKPNKVLKGPTKPIVSPPVVSLPPIEATLKEDRPVQANLESSPIDKPKELSLPSLLLNGTQRKATEKQLRDHTKRIGASLQVFMRQHKLDDAQEIQFNVTLFRRFGGKRG